MDSIRHDLALALRRLRARPTSTLTMLLVLGIGIGATLVVAAIVDAVLLRPLDFPESERLVVVEERGRVEGSADAESGSWGQTSLATFRDLESATGRAAGPFAALAGYRFASAYLTEAHEPEQLRIAHVSGDFFATMGVEPELGRPFGPDDLAGRAGAIVVIGHGLWQRQLGGRADVLGQSLRLDGTPYEIVGVMPARFGFPQWADLWTPETRADDGRRDRLDVAVVARIEDGPRIDSARARLDLFADGLAGRYPAEMGGHALRLRPLLETFVGQTRPVLLAILGGVLGLLAIVCTSVASLQSAAALDRRREMAVRAALGAGRGRMVRMAMTENLLLAGLGGLGGVLLAAWGLEAAVALGPDDLDRLQNAALDLRLVLFAVLVTGCTALVFGLFPSWLASSADPQTGLRGGRSTSAGSGTVSTRSAMVAAQVALTLTLLLAAGLTLRSFHTLAIVEPGFDVERVASVGFVLPGNQYGDGEKRVQWTGQVFEAVRRVPGVEAVSTINFPPLDGYRVTRPVRAPGFAHAGSDGGRLAVVELAVHVDYFRTLGIPLLAGRTFEESDRAEGEPVVVVSRKTAERIWGTSSPIGQPLALVDEGGDDVQATVVGVVDDVRHAGLASPHVEQIYLPYAQTGWLYSNLVVRATEGTAPESLLAAVQRAVLSVDPDRPLFGARPLVSSIEGQLARPRLRSWLLSLFSGFGLLLAALGIYSALAVTVRSRYRELGIRLALGSGRHRVRRLIVREGLGIVVLGLGLGLPLGVIASRALESQLYGIRPFDPTTLLAVLGLLGLAAVVAIAGPALRASRVDPVIALRED